MSRQDRRKRSKKAGSTQRTNHLRAMALKKVAQHTWASNQRHKTIRLLTEALHREPSNPEILVELATACGRQRYYKRAEELLSRLITLSPRSASMYRRVAVAYSIIDRPERAAEYYRRSLELNRDLASTVSTLLDLAGLYERSHNLAESRQMATEALERDPSNQRALLLTASLDRRQGNMSTAEARLRNLLGNESYQNTIRAQAGYELGQLLDGEEQYDAAFQAFVTAKQFLKPSAKAFIQQNRATLARNQELLAALEKSHFNRWQESAAQDTPYRLAVLTSHPRSGTTLVEQILDSHEQLKSADEFDVFAQWVHQPIFRRFPPNTPVLSVLEKVPPAVRQQARATYWQHTEAIFEEQLGSRMLLDKNPGMTIMLPVINWAFPEMKTLIALRDPRDVVLSCFMQKVPLTPISSCWLSLTEAAEYYARSMTTWLKVREMTPSPWLEFRYEDVVADVEREAKRILEFLELPWAEEVLQFYEHASEKMVRSPTYQDVTKPVYSRAIGRWEHYANQLEPVLDKLKPFVAEFGYK